MIRKLVGILKIFKVAITELNEIRDCSLKVIRDWFQMILQYVLLKHRCSVLRDKMMQAKSFKEWEILAKILDDLEGLNEWKNKNESKIYDYKRVQHCLASMKTLRKQNAFRTLSHMLR
jgi:hypothetical protein